MTRARHPVTLSVALAAPHSNGCVSVRSAPVTPPALFCGLLISAERCDRAVGADTSSRRRSSRSSQRRIRRPPHRNRFMVHSAVLYGADSAIGGYKMSSMVGRTASKPSSSICRESHRLSHGLTETWSLGPDPGRAISEGGQRARRVARGSDHLRSRRPRPTTVRLAARGYGGSHRLASLSHSLDE